MLHRQKVKSDVTQGLGEVSSKLGVKIGNISDWLQHNGYSKGKKGKIAQPNQYAISKNLYNNNTWIPRALISLISPTELQKTNNKTVSNQLGNFTDIGDQLGITSRQVGQYLDNLGYRIKDAKGTHIANKAFSEGLAVSKIIQLGKKKVHVTEWNIDKTVKVIKQHTNKVPKNPVPVISKKELSDMVIVVDGITSKSSTLPTSAFEYATFHFDTFNPVQTAILPYVEQDVNLVVCAATSAGKTCVCEMCISYAVWEHGKSGVFVGPLKALASEKYLDWTDPTHCFSLLNISQCSGDFQITQQRVKELENADVISITPEMVSARCRNIEAEKSQFLQNAGCLVFDESHLLTCQGRGDGVETAMIQLTEINPDVRFVLLSGTMNNGEEIAEWVSSLNGKKTVLIKSDYRPIEIQESFVTYESKGYYDKVQGKYKPASHKSTELQKSEIALKEYLKHKEDKHLIFFHAKTTQRQALDMFLEAGVNCQIFNADVDKAIRNELIEWFNTPTKNGGLPVLLSSSSLAWGVNMNATRVIIVGTTRGQENVEIYDMLQMKGRSGRPKYDTEGYCTFIVAAKDLEMIQRKLAAGIIIDSTFAVKRDGTDNSIDVDNTIAFHAIAEIEKGNDTLEKLEGWFKKTLAYHQQGEDAMRRIDNVIRSMIKADLIS